MPELIVIVESSADAKTATKLAERVLVEEVDWLDSDLLKELIQWRGLEDGTENSCWSNIKDIMRHANQSGMKIPRFFGHGKSGPLKADGAATMKVLTLIRQLQLKDIRDIRAVLLIRDLDSQPERKAGMEQARAEYQARAGYINQHPKLEIIIGAANRMREAWVLNGFIPDNQKEAKILEHIKGNLSFDPCKQSHRLSSNSRTGSQRLRNPKVVLEDLTKDDKVRERQCWEETSLEVLRQRGINTGLTAYLQEIEQRLIRVIP